MSPHCVKSYLRESVFKTYSNPFKKGGKGIQKAKEGRGRKIRRSRREGI